MLVANIYNAFTTWLNEQFFQKKLHTPMGYILMLAIALFMAFILANLGFKYGMLVLVAVLGLPMFGACLFNLHFGLVFILFVSFMVNFIKKYVNAPIGIAQDALIFIMFFTVIVNQVRERDLKWAKHPISFYIVIWIIYNSIQGINPVAASQLAWIYTVRSVAGLILLYFIACYALSSKKIIFQTFKIIMAFSFASAVYGLKQEWIGFSNTELAWLYSNPHTLELFFQWGRLRIFSFFSDPTTYGILMAYVAAICGVLLFGPWKTAHKVFAVVCAGACLLALGYAGSRTPVVLIPVGVIFYTVLNFKKEILVAAGFFFVLLAGFALKPSSNAVLFRLQSAFSTSSSDVVDVRMKNQAIIQPYIQTHPFGGGLGSTGLWGRRFSPGTWLSKFDHDSGFVRLAVEVGWIGLFIYMLLLYQMMKWGIYYYFRVKDPQIKNIYLCINTTFFMLLIASYPQEAILQLPTSIIFYLFLATIVRLKDFDPAFMDVPEKTIDTEYQEEPPQLTTSAVK